MNALLLGLTLGLGAGLAPGPLLALVIRSSAQGGFAAAARVAVSPLLTDIPIILIAVAVADTAPRVVLSGLSVAGGAFVIWLGIDALREPALLPTATEPPSVRRSILWGAVTNALSPHPWVFWIGVGAPILERSSLGEAFLFLAAFYLLLVGTKMVLAGGLAAGRGRLLRGRGYGVVLRLAGLLLLATGTVLAIEGLTTL